MIKDTSVLTIDVGGNCLKVAEFFAGENNDGVKSEDSHSYTAKKKNKNQKFTAKKK